MTMTNEDKLSGSVDLNMRVLLVDDVKSMLIEAKIMLKMLGIKDIDEAEDGQMALDKILDSSSAGDSYDLIISDINMPNMDGLQLLENLKNIDEVKNTPFLIMSTQNELPIIMDAIELGAANYIVKPLTKSALIGKLNRIFGHKKN
ncbi:MAG TPA: response regulator [Bacteriovoracaceae bacterium]|nr:response regulator [Bacteriovoracaceae bacterium]